MVCSSSQVILRTLDPNGAKTLDPYSPDALAHLTLTNLRIRLLKAQTCSTPLNPPTGQTSPTASALTSSSTTENTASAPYAIYTLLARGTCLCHGHAEYCIPHNGSQDTRQDSNMVSSFFFVSLCLGACQSKRTTDSDKETMIESGTVSLFGGLCSITDL